MYGNEFGIKEIGAYKCQTLGYNLVMKSAVLWGKSWITEYFTNFIPKIGKRNGVQKTKDMTV